MTIRLKSLIGGQQYDLPQAKATLGFEFSDVSAAKITYPESGINADKVVEDAVLIAYEDGVEVKNGRWRILASSGEHVQDEAGFISMSAVSLVDIFKRTTVRLAAGVQSVEYATKTHGFILNDLFTKAQARNAMTGITWDFNSVNDSSGNPWPGTVTREYEKGASYYNIIQSFVDDLDLEYRFNGTVFQAFAKNRMGADRFSPTGSVTEFVAGRDYTETPWKRSIEDRAHSVMVIGEEGKHGIFTTAEVGPFGKEEMAINQSSIDDQAALDYIASLYAGKVALARESLTRKIDLAACPYTALLDFEVSDWIRERVGDESLVYRIRSMALEIAAGESTKVSITLNDKFLEAAIRLSRKIEYIGGGLTANASAPPSTTPPTQTPKDTSVPAAPSGLVVASDSYLDANRVLQALMFAQWLAPSLNEDGSPLTDLQDYEFRWRYSTGQGRRNLVRNPSYRKVTASQVIRRNHVPNPAFRGTAAATVIFKNLVPGGFSVDSNADGIADGWAAYQSGTTGAITRSLVAGSGGGLAQRVQAAGLGTTAGDRVGVVFQVPAGQATPSVNSLIKFDAKAALGANQALVVSIDYKDAGGVIQGTHTFAVNPGQISAADWTTFTSPAFALGAAVTQASVYVWVWGTGGAVTAADFTIDNMIVVNAPAPQAPNFFDGAKAVAEGKTYAWVGTANASGSTMSGLTMPGWSGTAPTQWHQGPAIPGYQGFSGELRFAATAYMSTAVAGVAGQFYSARAVIRAIPGETPAGAQVNVRVHDGTGYIASSGNVAIPNDGSPVVIEAIADAAAINTAPRLYFHPVGNAPMRVNEAILEQVPAIGIPAGEYFDGAVTYKNLAAPNGTGYTSIGGGTTIVNNVSFGGKKWTRIRHPQGGDGARMLVALADLVNNRPYTVSATVYNESDSAVNIGAEWCDEGSQGPLPGGFYTLQPRETKRIRATYTRATYDATFRFHDIELSSGWDGSILVTDVLITQDTKDHWPWGGGVSTATRDGLTNAWSGTVNNSSSTQSGQYSNMYPLGKYTPNTWTASWRPDPSGAYRLWFPTAMASDAIIASDLGGGSLITANRYYAARYKVRNLNGAAPVNIKATLANYDAGGAHVGWLNDGATLTIAVPPGPDWTEVNIPAKTLSAGTAATARLLTYAGVGGIPADTELEFDDVIIEEVAGPGYEASTYYDGTTPNSVDFEYKWSGAVDDSFTDKVLRTTVANTWHTQIVTDPEAFVPAVIPGAVVEAQVRARDTSGHVSLWASAFGSIDSDSYGPSAPSTPYLYSKLGTITVTWDGLDSLGLTMPPDFDRLEVHMGTSVGFTPSSATYAGWLGKAGSIIVTGQPGGETRYFKLVAYDLAGNPSEPSAEASIVVNRIQGPDIEANSVTTNELAVGAVHAENIELGVFNTNLVPDPSFEEDYPILADGPNNKHQWRIARTDMGAGGAVSASRYASPRSGVKALKLSTSTTGAPDNAIQVYSGNFPVEPGKTYVVSINAARLDPATAARFYARVAGGSTDDLTEYPASNIANAIPFDGEDPNFAENVDLTYSGDPALADQFDNFTGQFTIPAGITRAAIRLFNWKPASESSIVVDDISVIELGFGASELTSAGLRLFGPDGTEVAAFVSNRPNYFSVTKDGATIAAISQDGEISGQDLSIVNDPVVEGSPLIGKLGNTLPDIVEFLNDPVVYDRDYEVEPIGIIEQYAKGVVAWGQWPGSAFTQSISSGQEMSLFELGFDCEPGRHYTLRVNPILFNITGSGYIGVRLRYTSNGTTPSLSSNILAYNYTYAQAPYATLDFVGRLFNGGATTQTQLRVLFCVYASGPTAVSVYDSSAVLPTIEDLGPVKGITGDIRNYKTGGTTGGGTAVKKTYTKTYTATNHATYKSSGAKRTDTTDVVQGYNSYNGNGKGLWTFPSMTADLSGSTVNKVEIYAYANHWYYNNGGTARIHVHGYSSPPASSPSLTYATQSTGWPKGGGRWVTLPSSLYAGFKSGTYRGFGMGPAPSNSLTYYGRFNGTGAKIRVTYTK